MAESASGALLKHLLASMLENDLKSAHGEIEFAGKKYQVTLTIKEIE